MMKIFVNVVDLIIMFECIRCTRIVNNEEIYVLHGSFYCRACMITIENDPDCLVVLKMLRNLEQIEN